MCAWRHMAAAFCIGDGGLAAIVPHLILADQEALNSSTRDVARCSGILPGMQYALIFVHAPGFSGGFFRLSHRKVTM